MKHRVEALLTMFLLCIVVLSFAPMTNLVRAEEGNDLTSSGPPSEQFDTITEYERTFPGSSYTTIQYVNSPRPPFGQERWYAQDFGWQHTFDQTDKTILSITLEIRAWDVDWSVEGWPDEHDLIYADGNYLGELMGSNNVWSITAFSIDPSLLADGQLNIWVDIDSTHTSVWWFALIDWSRLTVVWETAIDNIPPTTLLTIGEPKYIEAGNTYVTSATSFTLAAMDNPGGTGVSKTAYRIYDASYDTGWVEYDLPFYLTGINDGAYNIDYNSIDSAGNVESTNTKTIILDNTAPLLTVETPSESDALQDGVTFQVSAWDLSAVASVAFSIQCAQGNVISPEFESMPATQSLPGKWELSFDTTKLPDGYYLFVAKGTDVLGNWGTKTVQFSIRNWACVKLLPATQSNKAGRTMPVKFSLRIVKTVDSAEPFVWNEELTIKIYQKGSPGKILQTSTYGSGATDYRIIPTSELYITNFQTLKIPATYVVQIYRKGMLLGSFEFKTVK